MFGWLSATVVFASSTKRRTKSSSLRELVADLLHDELLLEAARAAQRREEARAPCRRAPARARARTCRRLADTWTRALSMKNSRVMRSAPISSHGHNLPILCSIVSLGIACKKDTVVDQRTVTLYTFAQSASQPACNVPPSAFAQYAAAGDFEPDPSTHSQANVTLDEIAPPLDALPATHEAALGRRDARARAVARIRIGCRQGRRRHSLVAGRSRVLAHDDGRSDATRKSRSWRTTITTCSSPAVRDSRASSPICRTDRSRSSRYRKTRS